MATQIVSSPIEWDVFREGAPSEVASDRTELSSSSAQAQSSSAQQKKKGWSTVPKSSNSEAGSSSSSEISSSSSETEPLQVLVNLGDQPIAMRDRDADIDSVGKDLYVTLTDPSMPRMRITAGVATVLAYYFGETAVVTMASKMLAKRRGSRTPAEIRAGVETAQTAARKAGRVLGSSKGRTAWAKLQEASVWMAKKIKKAANPPTKNAGIFRRFGGYAVRGATIGVSVGSMAAFWTEISQWFTDAATDYSMKRQFYFRDDGFNRITHFQRLGDLFKTGQLRQIPGDTAGHFYEVAFSPREVIALIILASEEVVGSRAFDLETTRVLTSVVAYAMKQASSQNVPLVNVLQRTEIKLPVGDPQSTTLTPEQAKYLDAEVHALLARFMRQIDDINDFDAEDLLVPITMCFDRLSFVPGVLSKTLSAVALGSDAIFADSFDEETQKILDQIEHNSDRPGIMDRIMDFISDAISLIAGDDEPQAQIIPVGGLNVKE